MSQLNRLSQCRGIYIVCAHCLGVLLFPCKPIAQQVLKPPQPHCTVAYCVVLKSDMPLKLPNDVYIGFKSISIIALKSVQILPLPSDSPGDSCTWLPCHFADTGQPRFKALIGTSERTGAVVGCFSFIDTPRLSSVCSPAWIREKSGVFRPDGFSPT